MERKYIGGLNSMLELLFTMMMFVVFGKLFLFGLKATWGITKFLFTLVFLPVILIGMVVGGLLYIALPVLCVVGVITMFCTN